MVKKILAENYIGQPHHVRLQSFHGNYLDPDAPAHWRQKIEISGLNTLTLGFTLRFCSAGLATLRCVRARENHSALREAYNVIVQICSRCYAVLKMARKACWSSAQLMRWRKVIGWKFTAAPGP